VTMLKAGVTRFSDTFLDRVCINFIVSRNLA
jgi:hypothetical protein